MRSYWLHFICCLLPIYGMLAFFFIFLLTATTAFMLKVVGYNTTLWAFVFGKMDERWHKRVKNGCSKVEKPIHLLKSSFLGHV